MLVILRMYYCQCTLKLLYQIEQNINSDTLYTCQQHENDPLFIMKDPLVIQQSNETLSSSPQMTRR